MPNLTVDLSVSVDPSTAKNLVAELSKLIVTVTGKPEKVLEISPNVSNPLQYVQIVLRPNTTIYFSSEFAPAALAVYGQIGTW